MKIILDAMGGDNAPEAAVLGALDAVKETGTEVILVGQAEKILEVMGSHGINDLPEGVEIMGADDVVDMHDDPATVIHKRKNSSMVVGLKLLADGKGDAFVSAGSTGAMLAAGMFRLGRLDGIDRPALAPLMPNGKGYFLLIDCGANVDCKPEYRQYLFDIQLAVLNEYVEFMEADEDEDGWYLTHASTLAQEILAASN